MGVEPLLHLLLFTPRHPIPSQKRDFCQIPSLHFLSGHPLKHKLTANASLEGEEEQRSFDMKGGKKEKEIRSARGCTQSDADGFTVNFVAGETMHPLFDTSYIFLLSKKLD